MKLTVNEMLGRLGAGEPIRAVCDAAGMTRAGFDEWWQHEAASRVPEAAGRRRTAVTGTVDTERDRWGIPSIYAENDDDLFFGFGHAMASDRLFQLDYLRRKATGRLSEVLGPDGLETDTIARTIGLNRIAAAHWKETPEETRRLLEAFSRGVNAVITESSGNLPVEFGLLGYEPEPWSPVDSLAIACELRYYLTVRFPVIVCPELAKRALGEGPLYEAFLEGEADDETILLPGTYPAARGRTQAVGAAVNEPDEGAGSNNWVISGSKTDTGKPLLASDPHIAFAAVSCWYEVRLSGGSFDVAGMAYAGTPAVMFGRNPLVAWGITNNICSQRDLYQEKTSPEHPGCFLFDGEWEPARELAEEIRVRGGQTVRRTVRFSRNGPIVDEILPAAARATGPVSLRWLGAMNCGWLTSLLAMDRAGSVDECREALRGWRVPTFSLVFADSDGHIGYQAAGEVPIRETWERGYRPGWDPAHQWKGVVPWEAMPRMADPERGWIATANNRTAPEDFPYPLSGVWASGHRARRIRQMIEERGTLSRDAVGEMHLDVLSLRAAEGVPGLLKALADNGDGRVRQAARLLGEWDCRMETDRVGATIFEVFFTHWCRVVAKERFEGDAADDLSRAAAGLALALLEKDAAGWFPDGRRQDAIEQALGGAIDELTARLGPDMASWEWGRLHRIRLPHVLSGRGELSELLDRGGVPVRGNGVTVCNTGFDPNWGAPMGANYRLISDMSTSPPALWAQESQGQSGHPGSEHYCDQLPEWLAGRYHRLPLDRAEASKKTEATLRLEPQAG